jgi:hypothetical protein
MITPRLAAALRAQGYDVQSCQGVGRANQRLSDYDPLAYATSQGRAIYTFNAADFERLDIQWGNANLPHSGIIVSEDLNTELPEMTRRLRLHLDTISPSMQRNRLLQLCF